MAIAVWAASPLLGILIASFNLQYLYNGVATGQSGTTINGVANLFALLLAIYAVVGWIPVLVIGLRNEKK